MSARRTFEDHFSGISDEYRKFRPQYPLELFEYLSSISPGNERAWDSATGTGQCAQHLIRFFSDVIATDVSESQIRAAKESKRITYHVAPSEQTNISAGSVDVITVAQALHWFDIRQFFKEVERVLKPNGILAVWSYNLLSIRPDVDIVIDHLYGTVLEEYWPEERKILEEGYEGIEFPFEEVQAPPFEMTMEWDLDQLVGYLRTWSAVRRYQGENGIDPVEIIYSELADLWGGKENRMVVTWPLSVEIRINT